MQNNKPQQNKLLILSLVIIVAIVALIGATLIFIPQDNPAYTAAIEFVNAAAKGDDATAQQHLSAELKTYIAENCPDESVSACVTAYADPSWGDFSSAVFRRSVPDGATAWDVQLIATYAQGDGFSGVCIYNRVEKVGDEWLILRWSGFVTCDRPDSGLQELAADSAPNRAP